MLTVLLPGPTLPLPGWLTLLLILGAAAVVIATTVAVVVLARDHRITRRHRPHLAVLPDPEPPRSTIGPTGELIDLDEARHRLMELR